MPASPDSSTTCPSPAFAFDPAPEQKIGFLLSPDERGQPFRVKRVEPALSRTFRQGRIGARRPGHALEVLRAKVAEFEQVADQFARALANDDAVGRGDPLQPGGQIGRVADDAALLRLSGAQEVADDHDARRDAHAHMQRRAGGRLQFRRGLDNRETRPHGVLGVVLVRMGIAKIGEHPVAHVFRDEAAAAGDQRRATPVVGRDDAAHVFGIEPRRHRGRAHEVAEHDRKLTALGGVCRCSRARGSPAAQPSRSFRGLRWP